MKTIMNIFVILFAVFCISCVTEDELLEEDLEFRLEPMDEFSQSFEPSATQKGAENILGVGNILGAYGNASLFHETIYCKAGSLAVAGVMVPKYNWYMESLIYEGGTLQPIHRFEKVVYGGSNVSQTKVITFMNGGYVVSYIEPTTKEIKGVVQKTQVICRTDVWGEMNVEDVVYRIILR